MKKIICHKDIFRNFVRCSACACAVTNTKTGKSTLLQTAPNPWEEWYQPIFEQGTVLAGDGETILYWRMVKPADFDPGKKYPAVVYVYGGPHAHCVEASWHWGSRSWDTYMAQKGYIVFSIDNRGSEDRGRPPARAHHPVLRGLPEIT